MKQFFIDTANINFIQLLMDKYGSKIDSKLIKGVTTNPNAFSKIEKYHLNEWIDHVGSLSQIISDIRGDNEGEIHIQIPFSELEPQKVIEYAKYIKDSSNSLCKIGMKIPPFQPTLKVVDECNKYVKTNVTGVADSSTALKCATYNIDYVSIIPGRMEEVGIDAISAISFVNQANLGNTKIITGSQRTTEQVIYCFVLDTIPTIGEKCWNNIFEGDNIDKILNIDYKINKIGEFSPTISMDNTNLSLDFFKQMDSLGDQAYKDLLDTNI